LISKALILDGYTDEPAGFGVPPYIDVYPRYIAGALWTVDPSIVIHYVTVDQVRMNIHEFVRRANSYDLLIVVAGVVVPGRYLGGMPISIHEIEEWMPQIEHPIKILVGAAAKWGFGNEGGTIAVRPDKVKHLFDAIVTGDPEAYVYELVTEGFEKARPWVRLEDMELLGRFAVKGAKIVKQHPNYGYNLIAEIETYRGCSRWISGGCSFCVTKLYGKPRQRPVEQIVEEVEALYNVGVRHFSLGRQADILVYGSKELESEEWPKPNPQILEKLFHGIRMAAPNLITLHIDNVNPGTIVRHEKEAIEALKIIIRYHTPGDVAALGIETADPRVVKENNLKTYPEESIRAIEIINKYGGTIGYNGLPELLPGINFVLGLIGETAETYRLNARFLEKLYELNLNVRRINVRKVLVLPGTRMWLYGTKYLEKHLRYARWFQKVALKYSEMFLKRLLPPGSILKYVYVEKYDEKLGVTFARQAGSYPIVVEIPCKLNPPMVIDVAVYGYSSRSVRGLPIPLDANRAPVTLLAKLLGRQTALKLVAGRPYSTRGQIVSRVGEHVLRFVDIRGFTC
jgi:radical SAM superfamily enzyme with C-terminal helix-hairpin-helix motif